ncbi:MAG: DeoR/GlpR family DNA-binding transcription regulator [Alphaproteobacteria bacterium]
MARPLAVKRHDRIIDAITTTGSVSVADLADDLNVSRETIRRDLKMLASRGQLDIVHGGATRRLAQEPALSKRMTENADGKSQIGRTAASLVEDGMVVLLDSGTTAQAVAEALVGHLDLTIITNALSSAVILSRVKGFKVVMLGGEVDPIDEGTVGIDTMDMLRNYRVDIAFVACGGVSEDGQPTDYTRLWAEQRRRMVAAAKKTFFIADAEKFGRETPIRIDAMDGAAGIIVDDMPSPTLAAQIQARGLEVVIGR